MASCQQVLVLLLAAVAVCGAQDVYYNPNVCVSGAEVFPRDHLCWGYVNYDFYVGHETPVQRYIASFNEEYGESFRMLFFTSPGCRDMAFKTICSLYFPKCGNATIPLLSALNAVSEAAGIPVAQLPRVTGGTPPVLVYQLPALPCRSTCAAYDSQCSGEIATLLKQFPPSLGPSVVQVNCSATGRHRRPLYPEESTQYTVPINLGPEFSRWPVSMTVSVQCFDAAAEIKSPPALDSIQALLDLQTSVESLGKCTSSDVLGPISEEREFRHLCLPYVDYDFLLPARYNVTDLVSLIDGVSDLRILLFADPVCRDAILSFQCAFAYRKCVDLTVKIPLIGQATFQLPTPPTRSVCLAVETACSGTIPPEQLAQLVAGCYANDTDIPGAPAYPEEFFVVPFEFGNPYNVTLSFSVPANSGVSSDPGPLDCPLEFHYNWDSNLCTYLPLCYEEPLVFDIDESRSLMAARWPTLFFSAISFFLLMVSFVLFRRYRRWPAWIPLFPITPLFALTVLIIAGYIEGVENLGCEAKYEPEGLNSWCGAQGILIFYFAHQAAVGMMLVAFKWMVYMLAFTIPAFKNLNHEKDFIIYIIVLIVTPVYIPIVTALNHTWHDFLWPFDSCFPFASTRSAFYAMQIMPFYIYMILGISFFLALGVYGMCIRKRSGQEFFGEDTYRILGLIAVTVCGVTMYTALLMWGFELRDILKQDTPIYIECYADAWSKYGYLARLDDGSYNGNQHAANWWCEEKKPNRLPLALFVLNVLVLPLLAIGFLATFGPAVVPLWKQMITDRTLGDSATHSLAGSSA